MCGIGGLVSFVAPAAALRAEAEVIRRRLRHRGPDGEGEATVGRGILVHTRLVLRDAVAGAQPQRSTDGRFTVTFNGELYDTGALAPGASSEAGALLEAWAAHGPAMLSRLNGMFAFFVWDERAQEGFLVRDCLGIKPAAYRWGGGVFAFASEAQALVGPRPRAHLPTVLEVLAAPCFSGVAHSAFEGIDYVQPGCYVRIAPSGVSVHRWASPPAVETLAEHTGDVASGDEHVRAVRAALGPAVARSLTADVPVGLFLSGGLDSTLLAALARAHDPLCFSIAFEEQAAFRYEDSAIVISDDGPFVALARRELGLRGVDVPVARAALASDLEALAITNDALPAWEQELSQHHLARAASAHVKAVLVGDAADETHYGYHFLLDEEACAGPEVILRRLGQVPVRRELCADPVAELGHSYRALVESHGGRWGSRDERVLATTLLVQLRWLPRLLHNGDIHTMRWSLEARVPFGDRELLAVAARVPPQVGLRGGIEKWALREAARAPATEPGWHVPEAIRTRRKSALPKDQAAGDTYRALAAEIVRDPPELVRALVDLPVIAGWLRDDARLSERQRAALFRLLGLAFWARHHQVRL